MSNAKFTIRIDQPVEDCELNPHAYYRSESGEINSKDIHFIFKWYKSRNKKSCSNELCPKRHEIINGISSNPAILSCYICEEININDKIIGYCSKDCFQNQWKNHQIIHETHKNYNKWIEKYKYHVQNKNTIKEIYCNNIDIKQNKLKIDIDEWEMIKESRKYIPIKNDVGHTLRIECSLKDINGSSKMKSKYIETNVVLPIPPLACKRDMVLCDTIPESEMRLKNKNKRTIRVMTYNILAELYATRQIYPYCPLWALNWNFRKNLILKDIQNYHADILCLQEVQADHYESFFLPALTDLGYDGFYNSKTRECMGAKGKVDGCAIFYKNQRFRLDRRHLVEFNSIAMEVAISTGKDTIKKDVMSPRRKKSKFLKRLLKDNIAQIVILENICRTRREKNTQKNFFCLVNTHIFSNPDYPDVKLWQACTLLTKVKTYLQEQSFALEGLPIIIGGDFNSLPSSAVYKYFSENIVNEEHPDIYLKDPDNTKILSTVQLEHEFQLKSAYLTVFSQEPNYTNFTGHWTGTIDYLWYTHINIAPIAALRLPKTEILMNYAKSPLPNCQYPSDHLPLCVDFMLK